MSKHFGRSIGIFLAVAIGFVITAITGMQSRLRIIPDPDYGCQSAQFIMSESQCGAEIDNLCPIVVLKRGSESVCGKHKSVSGLPFTYFTAAGIPSSHRISFMYYISGTPDGDSVITSSSFSVAFFALDWFVWSAALLVGGYGVGRMRRALKK